jgi:hypothetical protein
MLNVVQHDTTLGVPDMSFEMELDATFPGHTDDDLGRGRWKASTRQKRLEEHSGGTEVFLNRLERQHACLFWQCIWRVPPLLRLLL